MKPDTLFKRNSELIVAETDDELVMMDVTQGSYFALNQVGGHIWVQLETPQTLAGLIENVQQSFTASDTAQIAADVRTFITELAAKNLINEIDT
ncbi:PqqD family protein [Planktotalea sp.]|uniref:PqqD family protein n=1 Tax=Planktotalea sp. TaxID=2029877 RepID=UPI0032987EBC